MIWDQLRAKSHPRLVKSKPCCMIQAAHRTEQMEKNRENMKTIELDKEKSGLGMLFLAILIVLFFS